MQVSDWPQLLAVLIIGALGGWLGGRWVRGAQTAVSSRSDEALVEQLPVGALLVTLEGRIRSCNALARDLLFEGESPEGRSFPQLLAQAPKAIAVALSATRDSVFTLMHEGEQQSVQLLYRKVSIHGAEHSLLVLNPLTEAFLLREVSLLKKVIRVIHHELNNSLASLTSLVSSGRYILEHPEQLPRLTQVLDGIEGRATHLTEFLRDYSQLSRLPQAQPQKVAWQPLLERLQGLFPEVSMRAPAETSGWFDEVQVEQALINLIKNGVEAGGPLNEVELFVRTAPEQQELGVLDRGQGFSPEALQQGLLPFYSTKDTGSGVGLALCREVAASHGGRLRVRAREGGGSFVSLLLPKKGRTVPSSAKGTLTLSHSFTRS